MTARGQRCQWHHPFIRAFSFLPGHGDSQRQCVPKFCNSTRNKVKVEDMKKIFFFFFLKYLVPEIKESSHCNTVLRLLSCRCTEGTALSLCALNIHRASLNARVWLLSRSLLPVVVAAVVVAVVLLLLLLRLLLFAGI